MSGVASVLLSVLMIAAFVLAGGGAYSIAKRRDVRKGVLMLVCAAVLIGNVLILTL
jgi:hypothetical protein